MAASLREIAGNIHREWRIEFTHDRKREIPVVAISVVKREAGETPRKVAFVQPPMRFVHGDDVDVARAKMHQHRAQEFRSHFEMTIRPEFAVTARTDMMQHEDRAGAGEDRTKQMMRAGEVKRFQPGADDVVA